MKPVFNTITLTCSCSLNQYLQKWSEAFKAAKYISQKQKIAWYDDELKISSSAWDPREIIISICWTDIQKYVKILKSLHFLRKYRTGVNEAYFQSFKVKTGILTNTSSRSWDMNWPLTVKEAEFFWNTNFSTHVYGFADVSVWVIQPVTTTWALNPEY